MTIHTHLIRSVVLVGLVTSPFLCVGSTNAAESPPNVIFLSIDDLNDWTGFHGGHPQAKTPNLDRLAKRGLTFTRAYCAAPACNPSRAALMSGLRPSTSGVYLNAQDWRPVLSMEKMLTTTFRKANYRVLGAGKIYHGRYMRPQEWDEYLKDPGNDPPNPKGVAGGVGGIRFASLDCEDADLKDYRITNWCIDQLKKKHDKPFFLACGLHKPHMPWDVPKKYFDMFPLDEIQLPKVLENDLDDIPEAGIRMAKPQGDHAAMLKAGRWKEAVQAYLATISFTDMNVGRLLDALDQSSYRDNTIIVMWSDHGWHLGEKEHWRKFALWEEATRAPVIWAVPGLTMPGSVCETPIDFMTIYPTLCDLCGIQKPSHVEGKSVRPLLKNPNHDWDIPALTTHGRNNHAVRWGKWRYIRYADGSEELYDHSEDPKEWTNLARRSERDPIKKKLAAGLPTVNVPNVPRNMR